MAIFGAIEGGGTKFNCLLARNPADILAEIRIPTTSPQDTLDKVVNFFKTESERLNEPLESIGIGCFGPLNLNSQSPAFGAIAATPKPGWSNAPVFRTIQSAFDLPVVIDTDVNAAAIGEATWGAGAGLSDFVYFTIGTGIGAGVIVNSKPVHGLIHPEVGHILLPQDTRLDPFTGVCPFHPNCFESLATGPAIARRWGVAAETLPPDHPAWELEAHYIALALHTVICALSPQRIILGGGVMQQSQLFPLIRQKVKLSINGYVQSPAILQAIDTYIVPPGLGTRSGVLGALAMAMQIEN